MATPNKRYNCRHGGYYEYGYRPDGSVFCFYHDAVMPADWRGMAVVMPTDGRDVVEILKEMDARVDEAINAKIAARMGAG